MDIGNILLGGLVGAVMGFVLTPAIRAIWFKFFHRPKPKHLIGNWTAYHWTYLRGKPVLYRATWRIRRGFAHPFSVTAILCGGMRYKGHIQVEEHHICVTVKSHDHAETGSFRFPHRLPSNDEPLVGFWLSYDHDKLVATGASVLLASDMRHEEVERTLRSFVRAEGDKPLMRAEDQMKSR